MTTYLTAIPPAPEYGPFQIGRDSVMEILDTVNDIAMLQPSEWGAHLTRLAGMYPPAAFVDALMNVFNGPRHIEWPPSAFAMTAPQLRAPAMGGQT